MATGVRNYSKSEALTACLCGGGSLNSLVTMALASDALGPHACTYCCFQAKILGNKFTCGLLTAKTSLIRFAVDSTVSSVTDAKKLISAYGYALC